MVYRIPQRFRSAIAWNFASLGSFKMRLQAARLFGAVSLLLTSLHWSQSALAPKAGVAAANTIDSSIPQIGKRMISPICATDAEDYHPAREPSSTSPGIEPSP